MTSPISHQTLISITPSQWVATAVITGFSHSHYADKKHLQSAAVRQLLSDVQDKLMMQARLYDAGYPYYFIHQEQRYYICFSHSDEMVALALSRAPCGIDIEMRDISLMVATRFFHTNELQLIRQISDANKQKLAMNRLWQLKEAMIKLNGGQLQVDLGQDFSRYIEKLSHDGCVQISITNQRIITDNRGHWLAVF